MKRKVLKSKIERTGSLRIWRLQLACGHESAVVARGRFAKIAPKLSSCGSCERLQEDLEFEQAVGVLWSRRQPAGGPS